jgi:hypothetical protein
MIRKAVLALTSVAVLVLGGAEPAGAEASKHTSSAVFRFSDGGLVGTSAARLVTNDDGATFSIPTAELEAGPHTLWWIVFNHPEHWTIRSRRASGAV